MNIFTALTVVGIVAIIAEMIKTLSRNRNPIAKGQQNNQIEKELAQLKERISTLEAIVTDKNYDLSKEIDRL